MRGPLLEVAQASLQLADGRQVLVHLGPVAVAQAQVQAVGLAAHQVQHALAVQQLLGGRGGDAGGRGRGGAAGRRGRRARGHGGVGEHPVEQRPGAGLLGHERGRPRPGDVVQVGAAVAVLAVAGGAARGDAHLDRGQPGLGLHPVGDHLVDGDAVLDVLVGGEPQRRLGQQRPGAPGVRAGELLGGDAGGVVRQPGDHAELRAQRLERLQDGGHGVARPGGLRRPGRHVHAVRLEHRQEAQGGRRLGPGLAGLHRLQPGQRHADPQAAQGGPAGQGEGPNVHSAGAHGAELPPRVVISGLVAMVSTSARNRNPPDEKRSVSTSSAGWSVIPMPRPTA